MPTDRHPTASGFSLLELLLAFGLGLSFCTVTLQAVLAEGHSSQWLARVLRERQVAGRALDLLRADLQRASRVSTQADASMPAPACNLAGRQLLLQLETPQGPVTYSVGRPAEPIWRGQVLMRCGGAFALDGSPSSGQAVNRVLLDGLAGSGPATAQVAGPGALRLQLRQEFPRRGKPSQLLPHQRLLPLP